MRAARRRRSFLSYPTVDERYQKRKRADGSDGEYHFAWGHHGVVLFVLVFAPGAFRPQLTSAFAEPPYLNLAKPLRGFCFGFDLTEGQVVIAEHRQLVPVGTTLLCDTPCDSDPAGPVDEDVRHGCLRFRLQSRTAPKPWLCWASQNLRFSMQLGRLRRRHRVGSALVGRRQVAQVFAIALVAQLRSGLGELLGALSDKRLRVDDRLGHARIQRA